MAERLQPVPTPTLPVPDQYCAVNFRVEGMGPNPQAITLSDVVSGKRLGSEDVKDGDQFRVAAPSFDGRTFVGLSLENSPRFAVIGGDFCDDPKNPTRPILLGVDAEGRFIIKHTEDTQVFVITNTIISPTPTASPTPAATSFPRASETPSPATVAATATSTPSRTPTPAGLTAEQKLATVGPQVSGLSTRVSLLETVPHRDPLVGGLLEGAGGTALGLLAGLVIGAFLTPRRRRP